METLKVKIWRGREQGAFRQYAIPRRENQTVLDVVTEIQRHHDAGLSYRFACRVGVCGSCAMTVNGRARWTCRTHVANLGLKRGEAIVLEPLRNMPRIKDLVADMSEFFAKWKKAGAAYRSARDRKVETHPVNPQSPMRREADAAIECINCGICYASCDVVTWNRGYLGPAALNRAWTLMNDERHVDRTKTLAVAMDADGCSNCHSQGNCMLTCPVGISPARSIAGLKKMSLLAMLGNRPEEKS